jgi:hypothetical protein
MLARQPKTLALVALGPSKDKYVHLVEAVGDRHALFDETWTVNSFGSVIRADLVFHMDDVRIQEARAEHNPKIKNLLKWLKNPGCRVVTSRPHKDYPSLEAFPLEKVLNEFKAPYFTSTPAYALAYAILEGFTEIYLFGLDYSYPGYAEVEKGRSCVEYWIGRAVERGIKVNIPPESSLMDRKLEAPLYGYDTLDLGFSVTEGKVKIDFVPKAESEIPSGAEMERRYDHTGELADVER